MPKVAVIPSLKAEVKEELAGSSGPIEFTFDTKSVGEGDLEKTSYIGWVNQANVIVYTPATVAGEGQVKSTIPDGLAGLAFAALMGQNEAVDVNALMGVTLAGPAPVQSP